MREHDELTLDDAPIASHERPTADPADDPGEPVTLLPDAPRRKGTLALLAAIACAVFGSRLIVISALGSPMPLLDQWDGEADALYSRYLTGTLSFAELLAPHNEHRIFVFRLLAIAHLELAGEWNTRLEMIFGAMVLTAVATWLAAQLMPLVAPQRRILFACFVAFVFALPIGYENALCGFQVQMYLTLLFGIAALVAFAAARPFSFRWFGGLAAATLSYLSFATGAATFLAAGVLVGLQVATNMRKRCRREVAPVVVIASIVLMLMLLAASGAHPLSNPWTFIAGLILFMGVIVLAVIPMVWFCLHTLAKRPPVSDRAWVALGIGGWVTIQVVMLAYGRGTLIAPRYMDILLLVYPVGLMAVFALADQARVTRFSRYAGPIGAIWVLAVVTVFAIAGYASVLGSIAWSKSARQQLINVQAYLATSNVERLKEKGERGPRADLTYPHPQRLADILQDPGIRAILPPEIRPADADNAGARNRMWLKGSLAGSTSTAVRLMLSMGPALLALGVGLLFAIGAQRCLPGAARRGAVAGKGCSASESHRRKPTFIVT